MRPAGSWGTLNPKKELTRNMPEPERELLVILDKERAEATLHLLRVRSVVAQTAPPRIVLIRAPASQAKEMESLPGVEAVFTDTVPPRALETLSESEILFALAWGERQRMSTKQRPGEGLAWDAAGFHPPDAPRGKPDSNDSIGG